jgi:hypothetical protein
MQQHLSNPKKTTLVISIKVHCSMLPFGPYRIQYCLPNNIALLVIVDKFGPIPILVNINKLKPHKFQYSNASKGLESIVEMGRDTTNIEIGFNIANLENAQGIGTNFSFSVDGTENKDLLVETKNKDSIVGIKIQDTPITQTENKEHLSGTKILIVWFRIENKLPIKNSCSKTRIQDSEQGTKIPNLVHFSFILDSKYPIIDSCIIILIVNVVMGNQWMKVVPSSHIH